MAHTQEIHEHFSAGGFGFHRGGGGCFELNFFFPLDGQTGQATSSSKLVH